MIGLCVGQQIETKRDETKNGKRERSRLAASSDVVGTYVIRGATKAGDEETGQLEKRRSSESKIESTGRDEETTGDCVYKKHAPGSSAVDWATV